MYINNVKIRIKILFIIKIPCKLVTGVRPTMRKTHAMNSIIYRQIIHVTFLHDGICGLLFY